MTRSEEKEFLKKKNQDLKENQELLVLLSYLHMNPCELLCLLISALLEWIGQQHPGEGIFVEITCAGDLLALKNRTQQRDPKMVPRGATEGVGFVNTFKEWTRRALQGCDKLVWEITKGTKNRNPTCSGCP